MHGEQIKPLFFGSSAKPLFGCYHAPQSDPGRDCALIFCYSMGDEYIRFHRAFRQLAVRLAKVGFPVLRFDYYGCGDSSGECAQGRIDQWRQDIARAIDEIRKKTMAAKICLVGLRLGGALSVSVGADRGDVDGIVLWDPIVCGKAYLDELTAMHTGMLGYAHVEPKARPEDEHHTEILGFSFSDAMIADIERVDLLAIRQKPATNILIIESNETFSQVQFGECLKGVDANIRYTFQPAPRLWVWEEAFGKVQVPHPILQAVVSWISEVYS